jgi:hypothetical protein
MMPEKRRGTKGRPVKAWQFHVKVLGGHRRLAWKLGEMARELRILQGFHVCTATSASGAHMAVYSPIRSSSSQSRTSPSFPVAANVRPSGENATSRSESA